MCGIAGIVSTKKASKEDIIAMTSSLKHRGPDRNKIWISEDEKVALGHTRLSIIDLSAEASQPMVDVSEQFVIVFNGEIYNYQTLRKKLLTDFPQIKFKTQSDTEVILEAYKNLGETFFHHLKGMFAFALLDKAAQKLILARDRLGKKPLFYSQFEDQLVFASEIKSLLLFPSLKQKVTINKQSIFQFLELGYIPEPFSIYNEINKFPSGGYMVFDLKTGSSTFKNYWSIEEIIDKKPIKSNKPPKVELNELLQEAVKLRLVSDVPIGAFLSGGVDSSLVTAIAQKQLTKPIKTFTIGFKNKLKDETKYASQVSKILGTDHQEVVLNEVDALDKVALQFRHFDEPFADTSAIPTFLISELASKHVKVALTGDGGDELFLGYGAYKWANRLDNPWVKRFSPVIKATLEKLNTSKTLRASKMFEAIDAGFLRTHIFSQEQYLFTKKEINELIINQTEKYKGFEYWDSIENQTPAEKQAIFDLKHYLKDDLLVKVDRTSMYFGLECRSPLLDEHVISFAFNLPSEQKLKGNESKIILKKVLEDYLPKSLIYRTKQGFSVPLSDWLKTDLNYLITDYLNETTINKVGIFNYQITKQLLVRFLTGEDYLYQRIWLLIVIQKWMIDHEI